MRFRNVLDGRIVTESIRVIRRLNLNSVVGGDSRSLFVDWDIPGIDLIGVVDGAQLLGWLFSQLNLLNIT